ncbi:hypothetical protein [Polaromonas sp.]|uniref:hypothetical protein n=1 Tax=Polaromonas sp. TaxID=1869339 RepID=UPI0035239E06
MRHTKADDKFSGESKPDDGAFVEPSLIKVEADQRFQFERQGNFVTDLKDHAAGKAVFNRDGDEESVGKIDHS